MSGLDVMKRLYGAQYAEEVEKRLNELSPTFSSIVQSIAYDQFWAREGINIREKSLITIAALVAQGKEEQTKIHMRGFLESGGKLEELEATLIHLIVYCGFPAVMNALSILNIVKKELKP